MKKILFNLGDLSQLPGVLAPVYQVANMDIFQGRNPRPAMVLPKEIYEITPVKMSISDGAYAQKEFEKKFLQMQGNIENVDFDDYPGIENFLNFSLENIDDLQLKTRFKFDHYDNLEAIRTKKNNSNRSFR